MLKAIVRSLAITTISIVSTSWAHAQEYPNRPVKLVVPFAPGGGMDMVARLLGRQLSESMGQPVVIENKAGAGGVIGTDAVAKAAPDGYTIGMVATGHTINPSVHEKLPYDTLKDFRAITPVVRLSNFVVVNNASPLRNMQDLLEQARQAPGKVTFGSGGNGTAQHLFPELLADTTKVRFQHVPYKGGAPALADIAAGHITMMFATVVETQPLIAAGKLKPIAVTGLRRVPAFPEVPTIAESGVPGFDGDTWFGLVAPSGVPDTVVARLNAEVRKALAHPDVGRQLQAQGAQPFATSPDEFNTLIRDQIEVWRRVTKTSTVK